MKRYLVLEDEPLIAMDLTYAFEDEGFDVVTTSDCDEALDLIAADQIAGAVLDVNLGPGTTCEPVAKALNERDIPFVLHTGDLDRVGEALRTMGAPILAKPRPADQVIAQVLKMAA